MPMDSFTLQNDPPRPKPARFESNTGKQRKLFAGLNCEPGQLDLFPTDGSEDDMNFGVFNGGNVLLAVAATRDDANRLAEEIERDNPGTEATVREGEFDESSIGA